MLIVYSLIKLLVAERQNSHFIIVLVIIWKRNFLKNLPEKGNEFGVNHA